MARCRHGTWQLHRPAAGLVTVSRSVRSDMPRRHSGYWPPPTSISNGSLESFRERFRKPLLYEVLTARVMRLALSHPSAPQLSPAEEMAARRHATRLMCPIWFSSCSERRRSDGHACEACAPLFNDETHMTPSRWIASLWRSSRHSVDRSSGVRPDHLSARLSPFSILRLRSAASTMTLAVWCRSVINGWRLQRALLKSFQSLRPVNVALRCPLHRMSDEELNASVVNFSRFARLYGMSLEDVARAIRTVREAHADARQRQDAP
jgi:hypothetical protein